MAQKAPAGFFLIDGNAAAFRPPEHPFFQLIGQRGLDGAVFLGDHLMAAPPVKAGRRSPLFGGAGVHGLVPVVEVFAPHDFQIRDTLAAQPLQGVLHPLALGEQFFFVLHVPEVAAAALGKGGAAWLLAVGRRFQQLFDAGIGFVFQGLDDAQTAPVSPHASLHKHHLAVQAAYSHTAAFIAGDDSFVYAVFFQTHGRSSSVRLSPSSVKGISKSMGPEV